MSQLFSVQDTFPEIPENSPKKAKPFNDTHLPKHHNPISCQKGLDATLGKESHRWVVLDVRPIGGYFC